MITPSHRDWSLHRKGPVDQARHQEKIKEAIRQRLPDIVSEESIITSDGKRVVKVPIRSLEEYRFKFDDEQGDRVGQGEGSTKKGDVLGPGPRRQAEGRGQKPGGTPGIDYYEAEITVDELAELIFEDLHLPDLQPKSTQEVPSETVQFTEVRKKGPMGNLDKKRSVMEAIKRSARAGEHGFTGLTDDDLRFKVWEHKTQPQSAAVVLAMRDASGSMGEFKKYITRSLFFWLVRFLRTKYAAVDIVFTATRPHA